MKVFSFGFTIGLALFITGVSTGSKAINCESGSKLTHNASGCSSDTPATICCGADGDVTQTQVTGVACKDSKQGVDSSVSSRLSTVAAPVSLATDSKFSKTGTFIGNDATHATPSSLTTSNDISITRHRLTNNNAAIDQNVGGSTTQGNNNDADGDSTILSKSDTYSAAADDDKTQSNGYKKMRLRRLVNDVNDRVVSTRGFADPMKETSDNTSPNINDDLLAVNAVQSAFVRPSPANDFKNFTELATDTNSGCQTEQQDIVDSSVKGSKSVLCSNPGLSNAGESIVSSQLSSATVPSVPQSAWKLLFDSTPEKHAAFIAIYDWIVTQALTTASSVSPSRSSSPPSSSFSQVTRLAVRVQGDMPEWNAKHQRFVSSHYDTFDEKYRAVVDTVNMASVEGALKYVQAECINASVVTDCKRKNDIKYVVFYKTTVVQPPAAMEYYVNATDEHNFAMEHCPFVPMDSGQCDSTVNGSFSDECNQYIGAAGQPDLGFCVGGTLQDNEVAAPYPHNYWFSFPNSCPQKVWNNKTTSCRNEYAGGLCALGVDPDGVTCTFSYDILGYILLDDVVGITSLINPATGLTYANYTEFCEAGGVEFHIWNVTSQLRGVLGKVVDLVEGLKFWANPGDRDANVARVERLVSAYDELVLTNATTSDGGVMRPLPSVAELTSLNPPCYENSPICAKSKFGCKRSYWSQICQLCTSDELGCEKP